MSGLFLKDLYTLKKYALWYVSVSAIFIAVAFFTGNNSFILGLAVLIPLSVLTATISADKKDDWTEYALACGLSPISVAAEKALFAACTFLLPALASAGVCAINEGGFDAATYLASLSFSADAVLVAISVSLPVSYRFGTEKARLITGIAIAAALCGTIAGLSFIDPADMTALLLILPPLLFLCAAVLAVILTSSIVKTESARRNI